MDDHSLIEGVDEIIRGADVVGETLDGGVLIGALVCGLYSFPADGQEQLVRLGLGSAMNQYAQTGIAKMILNQALATDLGTMFDEQ